MSDNRSYLLLLTLRTWELKCRVVDTERVLQQMWIHFFIPAFFTEISGDCWYSIVIFREDESTKQENYRK